MFNLTANPMFPARAGMSRFHIARPLDVTHVPRASGDEPGLSEALKVILPCSPRERG